MQAAPDEAVLERAHTGEQVLISADTDVGGLLSRSGASSPSVILIRRLVGRRAAEQAAIILANLGQVTEDLAAGAMVVIHEDRLRARRAFPYSSESTRCPEGTGKPGGAPTHCQGRAERRVRVAG
jgi:predicted nuclease of predicted toxin-antitoxin system